jgi:hypothetical protein
VEPGRWAWISLAEGQGALCLACADLDHLLFLPAGNAALTRRAHVRHAETRYDELRSRGCPRQEARLRVDEKVRQLLSRWEEPGG